MFHCTIIYIYFFIVFKNALMVFDKEKKITKNISKKNQKKNT